MEIPVWWFVLSGAFFLLNLIFFGVLIVALVRVMQTAKELKPKLDRLTDRVENISVKVDEIAETVNQTVKNVGQRTSSVAENAQIISTLGAANFGKYAPIFAALGSIIKGIQMFRSLRASMPAKRKK